MKRFFSIVVSFGIVVAPMNAAHAQVSQQSMEAATARILAELEQGKARDRNIQCLLTNGGNQAECNQRAAEGLTDENGMPAVQAPAIALGEAASKLAEVAAQDEGIGNQIADLVTTARNASESFQSCADAVGNIDVSDRTANWNDPATNPAHVALSSEAAKSCTEIVERDTRATVDKAVADARAACQNISDEDLKLTCTAAVDQFGDEASNAIGDFAAAMGPVLAVCAASAGTACAIAAAFAIIQILADMFGGGDGDGSDGDSDVQGEGGKNDQPKDQESGLASDGGWQMLPPDGNAAIFQSETDARATLRVPDYFSGKSWKAQTAGDLTAEVVGDIIAAESFLAWISGRSDVTGFILTSGGTHELAFCIPPAGLQRAITNTGDSDKTFLFIVDSSSSIENVISQETVDACPVPQP